MLPGAVTYLEEELKWPNARIRMNASLSAMIIFMLKFYEYDILLCLIVILMSLFLNSHEKAINCIAIFFFVDICKKNCKYTYTNIISQFYRIYNKTQSYRVIIYKKRM